MRAIAPSLSRLLIVVALTTLTGCASGSLDRLGPYIQARSDDLSDVVRFRIAPGQVGLYADAEVTSALAPAVGFGDVAVFPHWALGWDIGEYDGDTVYHRPGGFAGFYANAAFLPDHGFGVAVLVNGGQGSAMLAENVAAAFYDELRGLEEMDRPVLSVVARAPTNLAEP